MSLLLATKLISPPNSVFIVPRPRLFARLEEAAVGKLTVVTAPAGYGKTTLVTNWLESPPDTDAKTAWLLLDEYDDELLRFMRYFMAALQKLVPAIGASLEASLQADLKTPTTQSIEEMLTILINELNECTHPMRLVLDDFHLIANSQIMDGMRFWIEHAPATIHTILICREAPPLPIARWRVRRQCTEIAASELCFTTDEAAAFVRAMLRLDLSDAHIAQLTQRTEGWIAGLQLAALSLQATDNPADLVTEFTGSDRHVMDYLIEEVLQKQSEELHDFLLQTSILKRLSPALCDQVTGLGHSYELLDEMEKRNLFLMPMDNQRTWYRYHPLFAEALQARLKASSRYAVEQLQRRAHEWFAEQDLIEEAIEHALSAHMYPEAAHYIEAISKTLLWQEGRARTYVQWCSLLPDDVLFAIPTLALSFAWAQLLSGKYDALAALMDNILQVRATGEYGFNTDPRIENELAVFEAEVAVNYGQIDEVMKMLDRFDPDVDLPNPATQAIAQQLYGYAYRLDGNVQAAKTALHKAIDVSEQLQQKYIWMFSHLDLIETHLMAGELGAAEAAAQRVMRRFPGRQSDYFHMMLARFHCLSNHLADAVSHIQLALSALDHTSWLHRYGSMIQIEIMHLQGNWSHVERMIESPEYADTHRFRGRGGTPSFLPPLSGIICSMAM